MKSHSGLSRFVAHLATFRTAIVGAACVGMLAGCGLKGPLFMPHGEPGYQATNVNHSTGTSNTVTPPTDAPTSGSSNTK